MEVFSSFYSVALVSLLYLYMIYGLITFLFFSLVFWKPLFNLAAVSVRLSTPGDLFRAEQWETLVFEAITQFGDHNVMTLWLHHFKKSLRLPTPYMMSSSFWQILWSVYYNKWICRSFKNAFLKYSCDSASTEWMQQIIHLMAWFVFGATAAAKRDAEGCFDESPIIIVSFLQKKPQGVRLLNRALTERTEPQVGSSGSWKDLSAPV